MPCVIDYTDDAVASVESCTAALRESGFNPADPGSLRHAARQLRQLGNNRDFLGDLLIDELARRHREDVSPNGYGPQAIMLSAPGEGDFFLRANIWPSPEEHMMRASGGASFVYGLPHDHNFNFLTLGYFGPGYWSEYYEYDYEAVAGATGEAAGLRFVEKSRLDPGKLMLYRAHVDVHAQLPADSLSVSLNVMHVCGAQGWLDQYGFDPAADQITRILNSGSSEAFIRIAVGLGGDEALDLAHQFARSHPSDRMRLHALGALASTQPDAAARDALWCRAEGMGSRLVAMEARAKRQALSARNQVDVR
jgi:hypothetical protein